MRLSQLTWHSALLVGLLAARVAGLCQCGLSEQCAAIAMATRLVLAHISECSTAPEGMTYNIFVLQSYIGGLAEGYNFTIIAKTDGCGVAELPTGQNHVLSLVDYNGSLFLAKCGYNRAVKSVPPMDMALLEQGQKPHCQTDLEHSPQFRTPQINSPQLATLVHATLAPITPELTTLEPITPMPNTPEPITPDLATLEPITPVPNTPEPITPEQITPELATQALTTPEPIIPEQAILEPSIPELATPSLATPNSNVWGEREVVETGPFSGQAVGMLSNYRKSYQSAPTATTTRGDFITNSTHSGTLDATVKRTDVKNNKNETDTQADGITVQPLLEALACRNGPTWVDDGWMGQGAEPGNWCNTCLCRQGILACTKTICRNQAS